MRCHQAGGTIQGVLDGKTKPTEETSASQDSPLFSKLHNVPESVKQEYEKARAEHASTCATHATEGSIGRGALANAKAPNGARGEAPPKLVKNGQVLTANYTRQQKRVWRDCLAYCHVIENPEFSTLRVDLTSAPQSSKEQLAYHHERLKRRVERAFGYPVGRIQHFQVRTEEGHGVLHLLWSIRWKPGEKRKAFFVPAGWLKREWERLHGAYRISVKPWTRGPKSTRCYSRYVVSQYFSSQEKRGEVALAYHSYSRGVFGFPLVKVWQEFRKLCVSAGMVKQAIYRAWACVLQGGEVEVGRWGVVSRTTIQRGLIALGKGKRYGDVVCVTVSNVRIPGPVSFAGGSAHPGPTTSTQGAFAFLLGGLTSA